MVRSAELKALARDLRSIAARLEDLATPRFGDDNASARGDWFGDWSSVPLVVDIETTAQVLNISSRSIRRAIKEGRMQPRPMPRLHGGKWQWSKTVLKNWVDGGYQQIGISRARRAR